MEAEESRRAAPIKSRGECLRNGVTENDLDAVAEMATTKLVCGCKIKVWKRLEERKKVKRLGRDSNPGLKLDKLEC